MDWTILLWVLGLIAVAVVAIPIIASTKPDTFRIERHSTINAPPEKVFPLINDFRQWTQWSPWEKKDPALKRNYSGAPSSKGSIYEWQQECRQGAHGNHREHRAVPDRDRLALHQPVQSP
jgi:uncharacterized protein YndB with AHSA1/START domain